MPAIYRESAQRNEAALSLKLAGATWPEIASTLGYKDATSARQAVERLLAKAVSEEDRAKARQVAVGRYERLLKGVWAKAISPDNPEHLPAVRTARELVDRLVQVQGAAVPQEVVVHNPNQAEIEAWLVRVTGTNLTDIVEAEVIDYPEIEGSA